MSNLHTSKLKNTAKILCAIRALAMLSTFLISYVGVPFQFITNVLETINALFCKLKCKVFTPPLLCKKNTKWGRGKKACWWTFT